MPSLGSQVPITLRLMTSELSAPGKVLCSVLGFLGGHVKKDPSASPPSGTLLTSVPYVSLENSPWEPGSPSGEADRSLKEDGDSCTSTVLPSALAVPPDPWLPGVSQLRPGLGCMAVSLQRLIRGGVSAALSPSSVSGLNAPFSEA